MGQRHFMNRNLMPGEHRLMEETMPSITTGQLPQPVRDHLPSHAREIYPAPFDNARKKYKDASRRRADESREGPPTGSPGRR